MRTSRRFINAAVAASLIATGALSAPAYAAPVEATAVEIAGPSTKNTDSSSESDLSSESGSSELFENGSSEFEGWRESSPSWAKPIVTIIGIAAVLEIIGFVLGPLRSLAFNIGIAR